MDKRQNQLHKQLVLLSYKAHNLLDKETIFLVLLQDFKSNNQLKCTSSFNSSFFFFPTVEIFLSMVSHFQGLGHTNIISKYEDYF